MEAENSVGIADDALPLSRFQTLEDLGTDQIRAIREIPAYGTQPPEAMTKFYPASAFTTRARFETEQDRVFRSMAVPVIPTALLSEPGMVIAHSDYGVPMIITRDKGGTIRAYLNACRHKGAKLVEKCGAHKAARLTCPYHSWTFGLDGKLLAIARNDAFDQIDKSEYGLVELASREFAGLVWVCLDRHREPDFSNLVPGLAADFEALDVPRAHIYGHRNFKVKANWKLVLEPFMESYHVPRLHASSIGALFGDVTRIIDLIGPHQRKVAGKINYQPEMLDEQTTNIHKTVTFAYQIFPNAVLITSPYYTSLMILMPVSERETSVDYYMLTRGAPDTDKAKEVFERSFELVLEVFGNEDFRAAEISQVGLDSGALDRLTYGGMENTIPMYYEELDKRI